MGTALSNRWMLAMACALQGTCAAALLAAANVSLAAAPEAEPPAAVFSPQEPARKPYDIAITLKNDVLSNVSGGLRHGTAWLGHAEAALSVDLDTLLGWQSTTAFLLVQSDLGSKFNERYVGAFAGVDNIEVATNTAQIFQAWIQKGFLGDRLSLLAGLYAVDSEFYVTDSSAELIAPPYGMANELAQTGLAGPPVFPVGALGVRIKYLSPKSDFYAMAALTDGVPGDPDDPRGTHIRLDDGDGTLAIAEFGYTPPNQAAEDGVSFNKTAIGFWGYSSHFADVNPASDKRHRSRGIYLLAERSLYGEPQQPAQGLAGFVRLGKASERTNQVDWTASLGLRYQGLLPGRDEDTLSLAVTVNHNGDRFRRHNGGEAAEIDWELAYRAQLLPWLAIQPDLQYIVNPGMDSSLDNACIVGLRAEMNF